MNLNPRRIGRLILGAHLPVPLFVGIYYFSYFYNAYHGFDHETQTYIECKRDLDIARRHLITDAVVFMAFGYFLMGIPSLAYSLILERHRTNSRFRIRPYIGWGVLMGAGAGLIATGFRFVLTAGTSDSLLVIGISCCIGGMIPLLLLVTFPERAIQEHQKISSLKANDQNCLS